MFQAVFALQEMPSRPFDNGSATLTSPMLSAPAAALKRWGGVSCRLGLLTAVIPLVAAVAFVVLVAEPLWQRLMTLVVVGLVPAIAVVVAGFLLGGVLSVASRLADPVAALIWKLTAPLRRAARAGGAHCVGFATTTMPRASKRTARFAIAGWLAWEALCWTVVRTVVRACIRAARFALCCVARTIPLVRRTLARSGKAAGAGTVSGIRATVNALDALGCAINAAGRMVLIVATAPIRLVARILLWLSGSAAPRPAPARIRR
jgi:hypothetical protein